MPVRSRFPDAGSIKVPEELADEIDKILSDRKLGYRSRAEFIVEATRQRLMDIKKTRE